MRRAPFTDAVWGHRACALLLTAAAAIACGSGSSVEDAVASKTPREETPATPPRRLGLWVPCEGSQRVLEHPDRVPELIAISRRLGVTDLFVQVYRGGRAWYDASLADAGPFRGVSGDGGDPLRRLASEAHAAGLRVHAWVNVLSLAARRDGPLLAVLGPGAVQSDRDGRSLLDYPELQTPKPEQRHAKLGTPAVWLDPGAPGVATHLAAVFTELVVRYPELDGLHLDYIRYPDVLPFTPGSRFDVGLDFGFGESTRGRFHAETGLDAPFGRDSRNAEAFDDWRRSQVTGVVRAIASGARTARPGLVLSAAVWGFPSRSYLSLYQDWSRWLDEDLLEFAVPMVYTRDPRLFTLLSRANAGIGGKQAWLGLGAWLFSAAPETAAAQLRAAGALDVGGAALFSYDALAEAPALVDALATETTHERQ